MKIFLCVLLILLGFNVYPAQMVKYKVKSNELLGDVLNDLGTCPLWGNDGHVSKIKEINDHLNVEKLSAGDIIKIPFRFLKKMDRILFLENGFIVPKSTNNNICDSYKRGIDSAPKKATVKKKLGKATPLKIRHVRIIHNKRLFRKDILQFGVRFNQEVVTLGKPRIIVQAKGNMTVAPLVSGNGSTELIFHYKFDFDLEKIDSFKVHIPKVESDFSVQSRHGKKLGKIEEFYEISSKFSETEPPRIVRILPVKEGKFYAGDKLQFTLFFDKDVFIFGKPHLKLIFDSGEVRAELVRGKSRKEMLFEYTIRPEDQASNGVEVVGSVDFNGGKLRDWIGNLLRDDYPNSFYRNVKVIREAPQVVEVKLPEEKVYRHGEFLSFKLRYDMNIFVKGKSKPKLKIKIGQLVRYASLKNAKEKTLEFAYKVKKGDFDYDGITLFPELIATKGNVVSKVGADATKVFALKESNQIFVDSGMSQVVRVSGPKKLVYREDESIYVELEFNKKLSVKGSPFIYCLIGDKKKRFDFHSLVDEKVMRFVYEVDDSDNGKSLTILSPIISDGARLITESGNEAELKFNGIKVRNVVVDTIRPKILSIGYPKSEKFAYGDRIQFLVKFSEPVHVEGKPRIELQLQSGNVYVTYREGNGTRDLLFDYIIHPTDRDDDGIEILSPVLMSGGSIHDLSNNPVINRFHSVQSKNVVIDGTVGFDVALENKDIGKRTRGEVGGDAVSNFPANMSLKFTFSNTRIESVEIEDGTTANLTSALSPGVYGEYHVKWSPLWQSSFKLGIKKIKFEEATNYTIQKLSNTYYHIALAARYFFTHRLRFFGELGAEQRPYIHARGTKVLVIDPLTIKRLTVGADWIFVKYGSVSFGLEGGLIYLSGKETDNFTVQSGSGYRGKIYVENAYRTSKLKMAGFLERGDQDTSISRETNRELGVSIEYVFPFGDNPLFL